MSFDVTVPDEPPESEDSKWFPIAPVVGEESQRHAEAWRNWRKGGYDPEVLYEAGIFQRG
ncbi:hypothetical protein [Candidatus Poriferisodalis sp.]|uniref:hypothetical protein n=1 Tax=Candidatus Poriferisodalis sp. TaxID=3101277 RepID=UPI003C6F0513